MATKLPLVIEGVRFPCSRHSHSRAVFAKIRTAEQLLDWASKYRGEHVRFVAEPTGREVAHVIDSRTDAYRLDIYVDPELAPFVLPLIDASDPVLTTYKGRATYIVA